MTDGSSKSRTHTFKAQRFRVPYTGTAVVYAHIEPGVRLISTIFHPAESVTTVISSTVRSFASNMPIIYTYNAAVTGPRVSPIARTKKNKIAP